MMQTSQLERLLSDGWDTFPRVPVSRNTLERRDPSAGFSLISEWIERWAGHRIKVCSTRPMGSLRVEELMQQMDLNL